MALEDRIRILREQGFGTPDSEFKGNRLTDVGIDAARGAVSLGEAAVGVGNLATAGALQRNVQDYYRPEETHQILSGYYSPARQKEEADIANSEGLLGRAGAVLKRPGALAGRVVQSIPSMLPAVGAARIAALRGLSEGAIGTTAAIGEGATTAAQNAQQVIGSDSNNIGGMYEQVPAGIITGAISKGAGRFGGNIEATLASREMAPTGSLLQRTARGVVGEGLVEEFPQSMQEQIWQNVATGLPWDQGVLEAGAEGALVGGLVGGGVSAVAGHNNPNQLPEDYYTLPQPPIRPDFTRGVQGNVQDMFSGEFTPPTDARPAPFALTSEQQDYTPPPSQGQLPLEPDFNPAQGNLPVTRDLLAAPNAESLVVSPEGYIGDAQTVQNARLNARLQDEQLPLELGMGDRGVQQAGSRAAQENYDRMTVVNQAMDAFRQAYSETRGRDLPRGVETTEKGRFTNGALTMDDVLRKLDAAIEKTRDVGRKETLTLWREKLTQPQEVQNATQEIPQQASIPAESQGGISSGQADQASPSDSVLNAAPVQGQEEVTPTESPAAAWEDGYRISDKEPSFADLGPELQSEWEVAVENGAANTKLFDQIVRRHNRNQRVARMNEKAKSLRGDLGDTEFKQIKPAENATTHEVKTASEVNDFNFTQAIEEFKNSHLYTPQTYDLLSAINEGRTQDVLKAIVRYGNKAESTLASALIKFRSLPAIGMGDLGERTLGSYDAWDDKVTIDAGQYLEKHGARSLIDLRSTVLHEVVHAATMRNMVRSWAVQTGGINDAEDQQFADSPQHEAAQQVFYMYEELKNSGHQQVLVQYGMKNAFEFVAEAMTNPRFQEMLDSVKMSEFTNLQSDSRKSLWQWLVDAVRRVLDIPVHAGSALSQVLKSGATLLEDRVQSVKEGEWYKSLEPEDQQAIHRLMLNEQTNRMSLPSKNKYDSAYRDIKRSGSDTEAKMIDDAVRYAKYDTPLPDLKDRVKKFGVKLLGLHQIDELYGNELSLTDDGKTVYPVRSFIDNMLHMGRDRDDMLRQAESVKQGMTALPKASREKLGNVLTGMSELNTKTEARVSNGKVDAVTVKDWGDVAPEEAKRLWASLTPQEQRVYGEVVTEIDRMRKQLLAATKSNMEAYGEKGVGLLNEILSTYTKVKGDYFPFMRFGDHVVVWKSDALREAEKAGDAQLVAELKADRKAPHYIVERFESKGEANQMMDEYKSKGTLRADDGKLVKGSPEYHKQQEYIAGLDRVPPAFINKLNEVFDVDTGKLDAAIKAAQAAGDTAKVAQLEQEKDRASYGHEMKNLVASLYVQALPEYSIAKRHLRRAGIKGYSTDAVRVYSNYADRVASATSKAKYMKPVLEALSQAEKAAIAKEVEGSATYKDVVDVLRRHYDAIINPKHQSGEWQSVMTNAAYIWYLGMTPSFAITNLAQGPLISAPVISARLGTSNLKVQGELAKAAKDAFSLQKNWLAEGEGNLFKRMYSSGPDYLVQDVLDEQGRPTGEKTLELDLSKSGLNRDEQDLIKQLYKSSLVDLNQTHDITSSAEGISVKQREAMKVLTMFAHHSEVLNRLATGLAAFRLAKKNGNADPAGFAEKIIRDTHFDYSNVAAPLYFKPGYNPVARIMFQFRKYQASMLFLLGRNLSQAFGKGEEAKVARKTLMGLMMTHAIAAGTLGMPLVGSIAALIAAALDSDDDPWDRTRVEAEYRNWLTDVLGIDAAEVAAHGLFRAPLLRDALPSTLNERVGQQDIGSPLRNMQSSNRESAKDTLMRAIGSFVAGPSGGLTGDLLTAYEMFGQGNTQRGIEYATPKFARDVFKAYRFSTEGLVNTKGETRVGADKLSAVDDLWQSLGFTPADISESYRAQAAVNNYAQALQDRRSAIITRYANAQARGDMTEAGRIRDELVRRFNSANPTMRILPRDIINAQRSRMQEQARTNAQGVVVNPRRRDQAELGRFANVE